jgi:hypothetical protein
VYEKPQHQLTNLVGLKKSADWTVLIEAYGHTETGSM